MLALSPCRVRDVALQPERLARLTGLYAIVGGEDPVVQAEAALSGGAGAIQVRMKAARPVEVLEVVAPDRGPRGGAVPWCS